MISRIRYILLLLLLPVAQLPAQPGPTQTVFWQADQQEGTFTTGGGEHLVLTGNVRGRQGDITIEADRAVWNGATRQAELRGNVKISQPGTTLTAPAVDYNSGSGTAITPNGAVILDGGARIDAGYGEYYTNRREALFRNGVTMSDKGTTVRAQSGTYSSLERKGDFRGDVSVQNDSGTLNSATLTYWRNTEESYATGNVRLYSKNDSTLLEADVLRNRPGVETRALGNVRLTSYSDSTILTSDTLINRPDVETIAFGNVRLVSTKDNAELEGERLHHLPGTEHTTVTGNPVMTQIDSTLRYIRPRETGDGGAPQDVPDSVSPVDTAAGDPIDNDLSDSGPILDTIRRGDSLFTLQRDTTRITADTLERFALDEKLFVATGHARMSRGTLLATAEIARFYEDRELVTLGPGRFGPSAAEVDTLAGGVTGPDSTGVLDDGADPPDEVIPDTTSDLPAGDGEDPIASDSLGTGDSASGDPVAGLPPPLPPTPIVWYDSSQLTGDSIAIRLEERKVRTIDVLGNAMAISSTEVEERYDQLASTNLLFNIEQDTIRSVYAMDQAASMYFIFEDVQPDGVNRSSGDTIIIIFDRGKASRISIYGPSSGAEGEIIPESQVAGSEEKYRLDGFVWYERG